MFPVLFRIGEFQVRSFGLVLGLGFLLAVVWSKSRAPRYEVQGNKVWDAAFWMLLAGILGARLGYIVQEWGYYAKNTSELFSFQFSGLTSFGGVIGGFIALWIWCRVSRTPLLAMMDIFSAPLLLGHAIGRLGCLLNGCCYGGPTNQWFGVQFVGVSGLHQPAQIYDSLMTLLGMGILVALERRNVLRPGQAAGWSLVFYGISRFIYEFWRAGTVEQVKRGIASSTYWGDLPITQAQAFSALVVLLGAVMIWAFGRSARPVEGHPIGTSA